MHGREEKYNVVCITSLFTMNGIEKKVYKILVRKRERVRPLGRSRRRNHCLLFSGFRGRFPRGQSLRLTTRLLYLNVFHMS